MYKNISCLFVVYKTNNNDQVMVTQKIIILLLSIHTTDPTSTPTAETMSRQKWWITAILQYPEGKKNPELREQCIQWVKDFYKIVEPFAMRDSGREKDYWTEQFGDIYGKNVPRLRALKSKFDPENKFRLNRNILPL